jgi:hypothetical protein
MKIMVKANQDRYGNIILHVANPHYKRMIQKYLWNFGFGHEYAPIFLQAEAAVQDFEDRVSRQAWNNISSGFHTRCYLSSEYLENLIGYDFAF